MREEEPQLTERDRIIPVIEKLSTVLDRTGNQYHNDRFAQQFNRDRDEVIKIMLGSPDLDLVTDIREKIWRSIVSAFEVNRTTPAQESPYYIALYGLACAREQELIDANKK